VGEAKKRGTPGLVARCIICTGESYKSVVKLNLRQGRVSQGSGPTLQLQSRPERSAARSTSTKGTKVRMSPLSSAHPPGGRLRRFRQIETFEKSESPRAPDAPCRSRDRGRPC